MHRLLSFSRQQTLKPSAVELDALTTSLQHLLNWILGEQINLICDVASDVSSVFCDRSELESCIVNLAVNARDAMPNGDSFKIEASDVSVDSELAATQPGLVPGDYVLLTLSDTGAGMTNATKERIFEPFFTTKGEGKGSGLPMVYGFVKQSGGHVAVSSELGRGTTFRLYLPRATASTEAIEEVVESPVAGMQGGKVYDDNYSVRLTTTTLAGCP